MLYRIEAVISTAGNPEEYLGLQLGLLLVGRPLKRMVITFEEELSDEECAHINRMTEIREILQQIYAITVHSLRISRNFQH